MKKIFGVLVAVVDLSNAMMAGDSPYATVKNQLGMVNNLWSEIQALHDLSPSLYSSEQSDISVVRCRLNQVQNSLMSIKNHKRGSVTPESATTTVRGLHLENSTFLLDESSPDSLIESFKKISSILLGEGPEISDEQRVSLIVVLDCYANASPGELTYSYTDDEQARIIDAAVTAYREVM